MINKFVILAFLNLKEYELVPKKVIIKGLKKTEILQFCENICIRFNPQRDA